MPKYLLSCTCGQSIPVDVGQAGGQAVCFACGKAVDIPQLRLLRHFPREQSKDSVTASVWDIRKGVAAAAIIAAFVCGAFALWSRFTEPVVPVFSYASRLEDVDQALEKLTPVQAWQMWVDLYHPLAERGFANLQDRRKPLIEQDIAKRRFFQKTLLVAAGACILVAIVAALWPRSATVEQSG